MGPFNKSYLLLIVLGAGLCVAAFIVIALPWETLFLEEDVPVPTDRKDPKGEVKPSRSAKPEGTHHLFQGRVISRNTRRPIGEYEVRLFRREGASWLPQGPPLLNRYRSGGYQLERPVDSAGTYRVQVEAGGYRSGRSEGVEAAPGGITPDLDLALEPIPLITGRVVSADGREGIAEAVVLSATDERFGFDEDVLTLPHAATDASGRFTLNVKREGEHALMVRHRDHAESVVTRVAPGKDLDIALHRGHRIRGTAQGPKGEPVEGAVVLITAPRGDGRSMLEHRVRSVEGGAFQSQRLLPGTYGVTLESTKRFSGPSIFLGAEKVMVIDRDVEGIVVGHGAGRCTLRGTLKIAGKAVRGARVFIDPLWPKDSLLPDRGLWVDKEGLAATDLNGRFKLHGLAPGDYGIRFLLPGGASLAPEAFQVMLEPKVTLLKSFQLEERVIQATLFDAADEEKVEDREAFCLVYRLYKDGKAYRFKVNALEDGTFRIPCDESGEYLCIFSAKGYEFKGLRVPMAEAAPNKLSVMMSAGGVILCEVEPEAARLAVRWEDDWIELPKRLLDRDPSGALVIDRVGFRRAALRCTWGHETKEKQVLVKKNESARVHFSFLPLFRVQGGVVSRGEPVPNARVCLAGDPGRFYAAFEPGKGIYTGRTDGNGRFTLDVPEKGVYAVALYNPAGFRIPVLDHPQVEIVEGHHSLNLETGAHALQGEVVDASSGEAVRGAEVQAECGGVVTLAVPDASGRFVIPYLPRTETRLHVHAPGYYPSAHSKAMPSLAGEHRWLTVPLGAVGLSRTFDWPKSWPMDASALRHACWIMVGEGTRAVPYPLRRCLEGPRDRSWILRGIPARHPVWVIYCGDKREYKTHVWTGRPSGQ
jgi:hypothetical protein